MVFYGLVRASSNKILLLIKLDIHLTLESVGTKTWNWSSLLDPFILLPSPKFSRLVPLQVPPKDIILPVLMSLGLGIYIANPSIVHNS
jgi:hypothetical protein